MLGGDRQFGHWKEARVVERGCSMAKAGEVVVVGCEGEKRLNVALSNHHYEIPLLIFGTDQECSASTKEKKVTAAFMQKW